MNGDTSRGVIHIRQSVTAVVSSTKGFHRKRLLRTNKTAQKVRPFCLMLTL